MNRKQLDALAFSGEKMPKGLDLLKQVYYLGVKNIYHATKVESISLEQGVKAKADFVKNIDFYEMHYKMHMASIKIHLEEQKLLAPHVELKSKSREELLDIILRITLLKEKVIKEAFENISKDKLKSFGLDLDN